jgi:hypothetical protein
MQFGNVWRKDNATVVFSHRRQRKRYERYKWNSTCAAETLYYAAQDLGTVCYAEIV